jgi:hypothetical protein
MRGVGGEFRRPKSHAARLVALTLLLLAVPLSSCDDVAVTTTVIAQRTTIATAPSQSTTSTLAPDPAGFSATFSNEYFGATPGLMYM